MDDSFFVGPIANNAEVKNLGLFITTISFFIFFLSAFIVEVFLLIILRAIFRNDTLE